MTLTKILITGGNGNIAKMIKNNLSSQFSITNLGRNELNILNLNEIETYLNNNQYDILVHTAILGGRRIKEENGEITHINILMLENLLYFADRFKMIINFDSGAIYDRKTDIYNRTENQLLTIPNDYYGFSKYVIYKRSLLHTNMFNFRIFNIFHVNEEKDRFVKSCFISNKNNTVINIFEDKYFDFVYEEDFIKIIKYYFDNLNTQDKLAKTINISYSKKYKLSDIASIIIQNKENIIIGKPVSNNYCGDSTILDSLSLNLYGLERSLEIYKEKVNLDI